MLVYLNVVATRGQQCLNKRFKYKLRALNNIYAKC